jgi:uncharacterized membrane protein YfcA
MVAAVAINLALVAAAFVCWSISTMSAGGGSVLILVLAAVLRQGHAIAPVVTVASALASPARIILFWKHIDWRLVRWYLPGATAGATLGGWAFSRASSDLIQVCVGLFLVSTIWQFRPVDQERFRMRLPWFLPVAFISGLTSAIVGASGLLANPFYLNYGLTKERMLATRAVNSMTIQIIKLAMYLRFGIMTWDLVGHGAAVGLGGVLAVWLTRPWLTRIDSLRYRYLAVLVMVFAGLLLLWRQRLWFLSFWESL